MFSENENISICGIIRKIVWGFFIISDANIYFTLNKGVSF